MIAENWLITVNAGLEALPDSFDKEHAGRLQTIRDMLGLILLIQRMTK